MELLLGLAIIVAVSELKEWRNSQKHLQLTDLVNEARKHIAELRVSLEHIKKHIIVPQSKLLSEIQIKLNEVCDGLEQTKEFILKADTNLQTVVKEYEINGIPLGYNRRKNEADSADFVEGL